MQKSEIICNHQIRNIAGISATEKEQAKTRKTSVGMLLKEIGFQLLPE